MTKLLVLFFFLTELESREPADNTPVHVINLDIQDNHEEATIGAFLICELATTVRLQNDHRISHSYSSVAALTFFFNISDVSV